MYFGDACTIICTYNKCIQSHKIDIWTGIDTQKGLNTIYDHMDPDALKHHTILQKDPIRSQVCLQVVLWLSIAYWMAHLFLSMTDLIQLKCDDGQKWVRVNAASLGMITKLSLFAIAEHILCSIMNGMDSVSKCCFINRDSYHNDVLFESHCGDISCIPKHMGGYLWFSHHYASWSSDASLFSSCHYN